MIEIVEIVCFLNLFQYTARKRGVRRRACRDSDLDGDGDLDGEVDAAPRVEEGFGELGETSLFYRIVGEGDTIVLLHGGPGGNLLGWHPIEALADTYRLVEYDQRGSGESERLPLSLDNQDDGRLRGEWASGTFRAA